MACVVLPKRLFEVALNPKDGVDVVAGAENGVAVPAGLPNSVLVLVCPNMVFPVEAPNPENRLLVKM